MKQYQLYVRLPGTAGWLYCDMYTQASIAWAGQMLARTKGMECKVVVTKYAVHDNDNDVVRM